MIATHFLERETREVLLVTDLHSPCSSGWRELVLEGIQITALPAPSLAPWCCHPQPGPSTPRGRDLLRPAHCQRRPGPAPSSPTLTGLSSGSMSGSCLPPYPPTHRSDLGAS